MEEEQKKQLIQESKKLLALVTKVHTVRDTPASADELAEIAKEVIVRQAFYMGLMVDAEMGYKTRIKELQEGDDKKSFASAENEAQTEEIYGLYKKSKLAYDISKDMIMLLKKIMTSRDQEYKSS